MPGSHTGDLEVKSEAVLALVLVLIMAMAVVMMAMAAMHPVVTPRW